MLESILSISGKPGLYKLISQAKNSLIVEALENGRRMPVHAKDRVVSLGDIAIFTVEDDMPLATVLENIGKKQDLKPLDRDALSKDNDTLREFMGEHLPEFDRDRVYPSDIKKLISWYNILIEAGITDFSLAKQAEEDTEAEEATDNK